MKAKLTIFEWLVICLLLLQGCDYSNAPKLTSEVDVEEIIYPTPADNLDELINGLASDDVLVQITSTKEILKYGDAAERAIPILITNLSSDSSTLRINTIVALEELDKSSKMSISDLLWVLENDDHPYVRIYAANALGELKDTKAIPILAHQLFEENWKWVPEDKRVALECAVAIAKITKEDFTDAEQLGYTLNEEGVPYILIDARNWWIKEGQFQDWSIDE